ncbi:septin-12 isoform X1 [Oxyura jamaicensis]|uniref:septin-12 isoform X1 n=2 Tax=Oxyura jamaicensis TaxID=8884 RepID=UPI0015A516E9|nr:septin-12 isoform X1 [Oxyura jamaicensis]
MARLSVKEHLDGILSDFEALKKSFEAEDTEDVDAVPGSPAASPLPSGAVESHRLLQPSPVPRMGTGPSPSHSPLLRSRLSASLAASRGPSSSGIARVASFQTRPGPGSDGESLRSSSSSLESPAPPRPPGAPPATSPGLKKVPSHGSVFPAEPERPLRVATGHGSLPALDLHIAEEPGVPLPASRPPLPWGARSPTVQPRACRPSSPSSSSSPTEVAPGLPRTQLRVCLSASPRLARPPPRGPGDATLAATMATDPGEALSLLPPPQAAPFKLVTQPQTVQVSSQPTFLGGLVLMSGTPAAPRDGGDTGPPMGNPSGASSVGPQGPSEAADGCCTPGTPEHGPRGEEEEEEEQRRSRGLQPPSCLAPQEPFGPGDQLVVQRHGRSRGSSLEPQESSMEAPAVLEELPPGAAPGKGAHELFGYVGIEAVLDQMRVKTMKTGFEFNIMVVGQSGLGKSTMVNTLFKSKVSRKASQPGQEERIPKTVQLQSVTHVIEEKGVKMKLTVTDTPGFGDQINNENCWDPIIKYINEQYERYLREEILITRKRKIPDTRVHGCVYFVPPTGHWLRPLDLEFMRRLSKIVNVVPVIAKADTLTLEERAEFKQRIQQDLKAHAISVYPQEDFDEDPDDRLLNNVIREKIPFAVVGADQEHQVNGRRVLGRKTKWGIIEVENPMHCEFPMLRDLLIRSHLQDLKDITHNVHYESYRVRRLNESNRVALSPANGLPGKDEDDSNL